MGNKANNMFNQSSNLEFSSYDFMSLFSAVCALEKKYSFKKDKLISFIRECKEQSMFSDLLDKIDIQTNNINFYSPDLNEAILSLRNDGMLYILLQNQESEVFIYKSMPYLYLIETQKNHLDDMKEFFREFIKFEIQKNNQNIKRRF